MIRTKVRKAFTLVEILIVVVILGILAAIVVPQFTNATNDAQAGNIKAQLSSLNRQIELYRARNNGALPAIGTFWADLVNGGYIKAAPKNPAVPSTAGFANDTIASADASGSAAAAWVLTTNAAAAPLTPNTLYASYFNETTGAVTGTATD